MLRSFAPTLLSLLIFGSLVVTAAPEAAKVHQGGTFVIAIPNEPLHVNPLAGSDPSSEFIHLYVLESLLDRDSETSELKPRLAEKWELSSDGLSLTFSLRKGVRFHDGSLLTSEDVKFTFESAKKRSLEQPHLAPLLDNLDTVETPDSDTIKIKAKAKDWQFPLMVGSMPILSKKTSDKANTSKRKELALFGTGPYQLSKIQNKKIDLVKNNKWWGLSQEQFAKKYNFAKITFIVANERTALERINRGEVDFYAPLSLEALGSSKLTEKSAKLARVKAENMSPKSYTFIGWNLRRSLFAEKKVRQALALLINRDELNRKYRGELSALAVGPVPANSSIATGTKPIGFDPAQATDLLKQAGWREKNSDGILEREINGSKVPFRFTLLNVNRDFDRYLSAYRAELQKAGIHLEILNVNWDQFLRHIGEGAFDAVVSRWTGTTDWDPKPVWHSASIGTGGYNFIGYKNAEVDSLIDQSKTEHDNTARTKLLKKVFDLIVADAPYLFLFEDRFDLYAVSNRIERPADTLKYEIGMEYWSVKR